MDPVRLRDDPTFLAETGVRLDDPDLQPGAPQMDGLRHSLQDAMRGADVASTAARAWTRAKVATAVMVGAVVGAGAHAAYVAAHPVVNTVTILVPQWLPASVPITPQAAVEKSPVALPVVVQRARVQATPPAVIPVKDKQDPPAPEPVVRPPMSLAEELRLYESGRTAMRAGNHAVAVREFQRLVEDAPNAQLWPEAAADLVQALVALKDWDDVERWAARLRQDVRMRPHSETLKKAADQAREHTPF